MTHVASLTFIDPAPAALAAFRDLPTDRPIAMINLLRFRERALYPSDHAFRDAALTGAEAYAAYGRAAAAPFKRAGGAQIWLGAPELVVIGPAEEAWHLAFVASYPTAEAFLAMLRDPEYQQAVVHRTAALADSRLIRCATGPAARDLGAPPEADGAARR